MTSNAASAVQAGTGTERFALVFMDASATAGSVGDGAARLIRAVAGPNMGVPIIATVDYARPSYLGGTFDDVLHKPFSREEVLRKLEQIAPL